jgi:hypothetical protein
MLWHLCNFFFVVNFYEVEKKNIFFCKFVQIFENKYRIFRKFFFFFWGIFIIHRKRRHFIYFWQVIVILSMISSNYFVDYSIK